MVNRGKLDKKIKEIGSKIMKGSDLQISGLELHGLSDSDVYHM